MTPARPRTPTLTFPVLCTEQSVRAIGVPMDQLRPQTPPRRSRRADAAAERANAAAALQRALDRRDNGGATGHDR